MEATISPLELFIIAVFLIAIIVIIVKLARGSGQRSHDRESSGSSIDTGQSSIKPRSPTIFLCYRREDSAEVADRIYEKLVDKFGRRGVFRDVDSIRLGSDFRQSIDRSVSSCDAFIAIIGRNWLDTTPDAGRRIDETTDLVRIEIESALARGIPVIPVLVRGASMPNESSLPSEIRGLAFRHGVPIRPDPDFHTDVDRLIIGLQERFAESTSPA